MKRVAKLVLVDHNSKYLLLTLNNHPTFGNSVDLPGGTVDDGESDLQAMIREVQEEVGVGIHEDQVQEIYAGTDYSTHGTHYTLYTAKLNQRPEVTLSWEHSSYGWVDHEKFLDRAAHAKDTFMHMVAKLA